MSDPHTLRHPRPATIHHLLDRLFGLHREESTPPVNGPRNPIHPLNRKPLTPHQHEVLQAVAGNGSTATSVNGRIMWRSLVALFGVRRIIRSNYAK